MFGSGLTEVAIGIVFVYLLLSVICSVLNEWISGLLGMRAKNLEEGIRSLFTDGAHKTGATASTTESLADAIYDHGLIQSLYRSTWINRLLGTIGRPSYIPARTFAAALLDILAPADASGSKDLNAVRTAAWDLPDSKGRQALLAILGQVQGDLGNARDAIENWYNDGMDRVSGWYKRKSQMILIGLAIVVTILSNADSILVARMLWNSPTLRSSAVAAAEDYVKRYDEKGLSKKQAATAPSAPPAAEKNLSDQVSDQKTPFGGADEISTRVAEINSKLGSLQLPIGWPQHSAEGRPAAQTVLDPRSFPRNDLRAQAFRILGWLATAIAVSLGAPFWFDILNKFMVVRNTVKPREKSQVEESKDS